MTNAPDPKGQVEMFTIIANNGSDAPLALGPVRLPGGIEQAMHYARMASKMYRATVWLRQVVTTEWEINGQED